MAIKTKFYFISDGTQSYRALGLGQRPFLDAPFTSHLRDLETLRRKATPSSQNSDTSQGSFKLDPQGKKIEITFNYIFKK